MDLPIGKLVLRTSDLVGTENMNANQTEMTWNNINLSRVLGNLYNVYEKFNLSLVGVGSEVVDATLGTTLSDTMVVSYISGLPFLNSTYNYSSGNSTTLAPLTIINFIRTGSALQQYNDECSLTFQKPDGPVCDIRIQYQKISSSGLPSTPVAFPHVAFIFNIYGLPKE
jgi:hypothetical protein